MEVKYSKILLVIVLISIIGKEVLGAKLDVGGSQGWDESVDLNSWASGQTFKVGDQLVFKYSSGLHSVVELGSEAAYKSCDLGTTLDSKKSGNDVIKLTKPGARYFACGTSGHCDQGMKMKITTVTGNAPSTPAASTSGAYSTQPLVAVTFLAITTGLLDLI